RWSEKGSSSASKNSKSVRGASTSEGGSPFRVLVPHANTQRSIEYAPKRRVCHQSDMGGVSYTTCRPQPRPLIGSNDELLSVRDPGHMPPAPARRCLSRVRVAATPRLSQFPL